MKPNQETKIRKPHDIYLRRLIDEEIVELRGSRNIPTALYFLREKNNLPFMGIQRRRHNHFTIFKKSEFAVSRELSKRTAFKML